ncbi:hypothetical protein MRX96_038154 [Rhipicephalus microplus]
MTSSRLAMKDDVPQEVAFNLRPGAHCVLMDVCSKICKDSQSFEAIVECPREALAKARSSISPVAFASVFGLVEWHREEMPRSPADAYAGVRDSPRFRGLQLADPAGEVPGLVDLEMSENSRTRRFFSFCAVASLLRGSHGVHPRETMPRKRCLLDVASVCSCLYAGL